MRPYSKQEFRRELARFVRPGDLAEVEKLYDRLLEAKSDLERGQWLVEIREILARTGAFGRFLHALPLFALRSAYRYISGFENCRRMLPPLILQEAMAMDMPLYGDSSAPFGRFTDAIKASPPPKNPSPKVAREWLQTIMVSTPWRSAPTTDPVIALREIYRAMANRIRHVQLTPSERKAWGRELIGMIMTDLELKRSTFAPIAVPESYKAGWRESKIVLDQNLLNSVENWRPVNSLKQKSKGGHGEYIQAGRNLLV
jgi:hypothetical protein